MKGILLVNPGSPKNLEDKSIKEYLREFLSDDLVIDYPKWIQQVLVNWIIVPNRYKKTRKPIQRYGLKKDLHLSIIRSNLVIT